MNTQPATTEADDDPFAIPAQFKRGADPEPMTAKEKLTAAMHGDLKAASPVPKKVITKGPTPKKDKEKPEEADAALHGASAKKPKKGKGKKGKQASPPPAPPTKVRADRSKKDPYGFRLDTKESQAATMYASKAGATTDEIRAALGGAHLNLFGKAAKRGWKQDFVYDKNAKGASVKRYFLVPEKAKPKSAAKKPAKKASKKTA
tara:strand:- start:25563 stop:26174 length:612 start_codon:yes stop_codon:yes gene_type:complete